MKLSILLFLCSCDMRASETIIRGEKGEQGEQGERGPRGAAGLPGASCDESLADMVVRQKTVAIGVDEVQRAEVYCDEGELPVSGGCRFGLGKIAGIFPYESMPAVSWRDDGDATFAGYVCSALNASGETSEVTAFIVCEVP